MSEECRSCHAPIDWAYADTDPEPDGRPKANPVDHGSADDPQGNLEVWRDPVGVLRYRYLRKGQEPEPGHHRGISHFATCPDRDGWRRGLPAWLQGPGVSVRGGCRPGGAGSGRGGLMAGGRQGSGGHDHDGGGDYADADHEQGSSRETTSLPVTVTRCDCHAKGRRRRLSLPSCPPPHIINI